MARTPRRRPSLEALEDRNLPAALGLPWPDSGHLTLSVATRGETAVDKATNRTNAVRITIDHANSAKALGIDHSVGTESVRAAVIARITASATSNTNTTSSLIHTDALGPTPTDPGSTAPGDTTDPDPVSPTEPPTTTRRPTT